MDKNKSIKNIKYVSLSPLFPVGRTPVGIYDFIKQVDRVYLGLGIPTLYGVLSVLANKSVFYIAGRGIGKTRVINLIPKIKGIIESKWDTFTLSQLDGYNINNAHLVFKVEDFSSTSKYHRQTFLRIFSKIISDRSFHHYTKGPNGLSIDIQNCSLTVLAAIQPLLYSNLCNKFSEWESMSYDRFSKFLLLNPLRKSTIDAAFIPTLAGKINHDVIFHADDVNLQKIVSMYKGQVSTGRAYLYARDYVTALAKFMCSSRVDQRHVEWFYQLFHPYLEPFNVLQKARDLDSPVQVSAGDLKLLTEIAKHNDIISKEQLARDLHVDERSIERNASSLINAGLIQKPKPAHYCLSERLRDFFQRYRNTL